MAVAWGGPANGMIHETGATHARPGVGPRAEPSGKVRGG